MVTSDGSDHIAVESADPAYFTGGDCPRHKRCRYSDSAFATYDTATTGALGAIAQTDGVNTGSVTVGSTNFSITAVGSGNATVGTTLNKVGRTTGWSQGTVSRSCADTAMSGTNIVLLCQDFVDAAVGSGDSGAPVFAITSGSNVTLQGILWGGSRRGTTFIYSPIANVQMPSELGPLTTH